MHQTKGSQKNRHQIKKVSEKSDIGLKGLRKKGHQTKRSQEKLHQTKICQKKTHQTKKVPEKTALD